MGRLTVVSVLTILAVWLVPAHAENHVTAEDCQKISEGKFLLKAVPADVAESCRNLAAIAPAAGSQPLSADASAADPCVGENAGSSVRCWGPWALLAPAATAGGGFPSVYTDQIPPEERPEVFALNTDGSPVDPPIEPPEPPVLPLGPCEAGASCGFATLITGVGAIGDPATAEIVNFDMALDGTSFTASPGEANEVQSIGGMNPVFIDRADGYENMDSLGVTTTQVSQALARVFRQNGTDLSYAADVWGEADLESGEVNSGVFAWGMTATQAELDALNAGMGMSMNFTGPMSADPTTISNITLNFGPDSNWTGSWTNPGYSFTAGGGIIGPNFGSDPTQFSSNVNQGSSYVQGALVGNTGAHAAIHVIDVTLDGAGRIRDVGLARQSP